MTTTELQAMLPAVDKGLGLADVTIASLREQYAGLTIADLNDKDGYKAVREAIADVRSTRVNVEKSRKELKADALAWGKKVDTEAKRVTAMLMEIEEPLKIEKAKVDDEKARIKAEEAAAIERRREELLRKKLEAEADERRKEEEAKAEVRRKEEDARRVEQEKQAAEIEKERAALEKERIDYEARMQKQADKLKADQAEIQAQRDAIEKERQEAKAEQQRIAKEKAKADQEEADRIQAEQDELEEEKFAADEDSNTQVSSSPSTMTTTGRVQVASLNARFQAVVLNMEAKANTSFRPQYVEGLRAAFFHGADALADMVYEGCVLEEVSAECRRELEEIVSK